MLEKEWEATSQEGGQPRNKIPGFIFSEAPLNVEGKSVRSCFKATRFNKNHSDFEKEALHTTGLSKGFEVTTDVVTTPNRPAYGMMSAGKPGCECSQNGHGSMVQNV